MGLRAAGTAPRRWAAMVLAVTGVTVTLIAGAPAASASGCTTPPCGALNNKTDKWILVKWTDNDGRTWEYGNVAPHTTMGGWWNDGIDVDFWYTPDWCTDNGNIHGGWHKISSYETRVINSRTC
jgi:hypothetical protein